MLNLEKREDRIWLAQRNFASFFALYFPHYFLVEPAEFHKDLASLLQDSEKPQIEIIGFRGSAKTTYGCLAFPLWAAITGKYPFILMVNETGAQTELNLANLRHELEENQLLLHDFPHLKMADVWTKNKVLLRNGTLILGRSRGQKIRGLRHRQYRPSLIVIDDPEDLDAVRTKEGRDKTERWFRGEVIPSRQETGAKLIVIGNMLHTDGLIARLKKNGRFEVIEFPLINEEGECLWSAKYPTTDALENQRKDVGETAWMREFLLKVVSEEGQVVTEEEIAYYANERLTSNIEGLRIQATNGGAGVDLAISEKTTADYTAMVSGLLSREDGRDVLYILPNPVHDRLDLYQTVERARAVTNALPLGSKLFVEEVAYQQAAVKEMKRKGLPAEGMRPITDKRARLETAAVYIKQGAVRFPQTGCEDLIQEILGFGIESHDDYVDAVCMLILGMFGRKKAFAGAGRGDRI